MPIERAAAVVYAGLAVLFAFTWERFDEEPLAPSLLEDALFVGAILIHPVAGFLIPRLWALVLPFVSLVVILPFSEPDPELQGITDAGVMFFGSFFAMILIAFGISCRLTLRMLREPR